MTVVTCCSKRQYKAYLPEFRADYNRRFARPARNTYDAHRPVHENLDQVLTVQEDRRLSGNLTLTYNRTLYVIEDTVEHRRLRGHRVTVHEHADGTLIIRYGDRVLPHRAYPKDTARITQGTIVDPKRLGATLQWIAGRQRDRDLQAPANRHLTLRQKHRIRTAAGLPA